MTRALISSLYSQTHIAISNNYAEIQKASAKGNRLLGTYYRVKFFGAAGEQKDARVIDRVCGDVFPAKNRACAKNKFPAKTPTVCVYTWPIDPRPFQLAWQRH